MFRMIAIALLSCALAISATPVPRQVNETVCQEFNQNELRFVGKSWSELEPADVTDWENLGYTEALWISCNSFNKTETTCPESELTDWAELSPTEQTSATNLGYTENTWDNFAEYNVECIVYKCRDFNENELRFDKDWSELEPADIADWENLGYTEAFWDSCDSTNMTNTTCPESELKDWAELSPTEQTSATNLGYSENTWDSYDQFVSNCKVYICQDFNENELRFDRDWSELEPADIADWENLGYTEAFWDSCDSTNMTNTTCPESELKDWAELSPTEQTSATNLGYSEHTWDKYDEYISMC